jgi:surface protein
MREMFLRSYLFNSDIGSWKTEAVTDMREMFRQASSFNHDIGEWITSQVTDSYSMFYEATAFQNKFTCSDVNHGPPSSCAISENF